MNTKTIAFLNLLPLPRKPRSVKMVTPIIGRILNSRSKTLDLSQKRLKKCPDMICLLHKLEKVILTNNELKEVPDDFGNLKQVRKTKRKCIFIIHLVIKTSLLIKALHHIVTHIV